MKGSLPIILVLACLTFASNTAFGEGLQARKTCVLLPSFETSSATFVTKGPYKRAFRASKTTTWKKAHRAFSKEFGKQERETLRLFQSPGDTEVSNKEIQRFLEKYVLGPHPALLTTDDGFALRPEVAMTWVRAQCETGVQPDSWKGLAGLTTEDHPRLLEAFAAQHLMAGRLSETLTLLSEALGLTRPSIPVLVIASITQARLGESEQALALSARANELCMGPKECSRASWLREQLMEGRDESTP